MYLNHQEIARILACYGMELLSLDEERDSSRGEDDLRYHYFVNGQYVLHCASGMPMDETRLQEIARLIDHYRDIQVYCPQLIPSLKGAYIVQHSVGGREFSCYLDERAPYPTAEEKGNWDQIHLECCRVLGRLAAAYSGRELSGRNSMWCLIDPPPWGGEMDEKQENMLQLTEAIETAGNPELALRLKVFVERVRTRIARDYQRLPRCVFQGDLNASNILVDEGHMKGLIDFNMAGTEVNINCFLNETDSFPEEEELLSQSAATVWENSLSVQQRKLDEIFHYYPLNALETELLPWYRVNIFLFQWPNVCLMDKLLKEEDKREIVFRLIEYVLMLHEEEIE